MIILFFLFQHVFLVSYNSSSRTNNLCSPAWVRQNNVLWYLLWTGCDVKVMFCLDYALAFFFHSLLSRFFLDPGSPSSSSTTLIHFPLGAISGIAAAVCLYPFDIVRMTTVERELLTCIQYHSIHVHVSGSILHTR